MSDDHLRDIDLEDLLADVAELLKECGDWRAHIGFEAACAFTSDYAVRELYMPHVSKCAYCQRMIDLYS